MAKLVVAVAMFEGDSATQIYHGIDLAVCGDRVRVTKIGDWRRMHYRLPDEEAGQAMLRAKAYLDETLRPGRVSFTMEQEPNG